MEMLLNALHASEQKMVLPPTVHVWRSSASFDQVVKWIDDRASRFDVETMGHLERAAASNLIASDPERATGWLMERATEETLSFHLQEIAQRWASTAPNAAGEWLGKLPEGPQNDYAFSVFAQIVLKDDPESAAHWAASITEDKLREQTLGNVLRKWKLTNPGAAESFSSSLRK
jgi:hypothetical protein